MAGCCRRRGGSFPSRGPVAPSRARGSYPASGRSRSGRRRRHPPTANQERPLAMDEEGASGPAVGSLLLAARAQVPGCVSRCQSRSESPTLGWSRKSPRVRQPRPTALTRGGRVLKRAEQSLLPAKSAAVKPAGLSMAQYVALAELDAQPGVTGASLARACLVTPQAMMVVLKAMQEQGLIERTPNPPRTSASVGGLAGTLQGPGPARTRVPRRARLQGGSRLTPSRGGTRSDASRRRVVLQRRGSGVDWNARPLADRFGREPPIESRRSPQAVGNTQPRTLDRADEHALSRAHPPEVECLPATLPFCQPPAAPHQTMAQHGRI